MNVKMRNCSIPDQNRQFPCTRQMISEWHDVLVVKPEYALDGKCEFLLKTGVVLVWRQINPIETGMALRQLRRVTRFFDRETSGTIRALQIFEAIDGYARSSGRKLKKS